MCSFTAMRLTFVSILSFAVIIEGQPEGWTFPTDLKSLFFGPPNRQPPYPNFRCECCDTSTKFGAPWSDKCIIKGKTYTCIPYELDEQLQSDVALKQVYKAMYWFREQTCYAWVPRTVQPDYVSFEKAAECFSDGVGKIGGKQGIHISPGCFWATLIFHEMMHTMGFHHTHQRPDRDKYIAVKMENISPETACAFEPLLRKDVTFVDWDFNSLMLYGSRDFRKASLVKGNNACNQTNCWTLMSKDGNFLRPVSRKKGPSPADIRAINAKGGCPFLDSVQAPALFPAPALAPYSAGMTPNKAQYPVPVQATAQNNEQSPVSVPSPEGQYSVPGSIPTQTRAQSPVPVTAPVPSPMNPSSGE